MPLLKKKTGLEKHQTRINILKSVFDEAEAYQKWANLPRVDDVIELALELAFSKDRDWKKYKATKKD